MKRAARGARAPEDRPLFVVGMPRSGTTLLFEALATHPELGWLSYNFDRAPRLPALSLTSRLADWSHAFRKAVSRSDQERGLLERLRVGPSEAYRVWSAYCGERFAFDHLLDAAPGEEERRAVRAMVRSVLRWHGKRRFAAKLTGPARIGYLRRLFDDPVFVHVIRDGRAVVGSLMRVDFWRESFRMREPAWRGGLRRELLEAWEASGRSPAVLAAIQWRAVVENARSEARALPPGRYHEVFYEDLLRDPHAALEDVFASCGLERRPEPHDFLDARFELRDMNTRWRGQFGAAEREQIEQVIGDLLGELGYALGRGAEARSSSS